MTANLLLLRFPARSRWPDGSNATSPLNGCRGGVADYSSSGDCAGILSRGDQSPTLQVEADKISGMYWNVIWSR
jgi:hypothetical protein